MFRKCGFYLVLIINIIGSRTFSFYFIGQKLNFWSSRDTESTINRVFGLKMVLQNIRNYLNYTIYQKCGGIIGLANLSGMCMNETKVEGGIVPANLAGM